MAGHETCEENSYKVLIIGDTNVGKTSLLLRYVDNTFEASRTTIGFDVKTKVEKVGHGTQAKLHIYDTAGQEKYGFMTSSFFRGTDGVVYAFDICDKNTLTNVPKWSEFINRYCTVPPIRILVGTKSDLSGQRQVSTEEAKEFAAKWNMHYVEVSAKQGTHVQSLFHDLAQKMHEKRFQTMKQNNALTVAKPTLKTKLKKLFSPKIKSKQKTRCSH